MFFAKKEESGDLEKNRVYRFLKRFLPLIAEDGNGKLTVRRKGKKYYTTIFVVIVLLATTDIVFALDSIPAVFGITQDRLVIYTSNIFAVLGLRSLFFLLRGAVDKFRFLQKGIATVLVFVGLKMTSELIHVKVSTLVSLIVIVVCIGSSILLSQFGKENIHLLKNTYLRHSIRHIASIVSGSFLQFHEDDPVEQLLTDSRRLVYPETTLFFALKGPRRNGEAFIPDLYLRGVRNFIVSHQVVLKDFPQANIILVENSLRALAATGCFSPSAI